MEIDMAFEMYKEKSKKGSSRAEPEEIADIDKNMNPEPTDGNRQVDEMEKLRTDISNLMADLMIDTKLIKLDKPEFMLEQGKKYIHAHNSRLNEIMALIDRIVNQKCLEARIDEATKAEYKLLKNQADKTSEEIAWQLVDNWIFAFGSDLRDKYLQLKKSQESVKGDKER